MPDTDIVPANLIPKAPPSGSDVVPENMIPRRGGPVDPAAPEIQKPLPRAVEFGEQYVAPAVGAIVGGLVGAPGGPLMSAEGAAAGMTAADIGSALINRKFFGRHPDLSAKNVIESGTENFLVNSIFDLGGKAILPAIVGAKQAELGAREAQVEGTKAAEKFTEKTGTLAEQATQSFKPQEIVEQMAPQARQAVIQKSIGRTPEQATAAGFAAGKGAPGTAIGSAEALGRIDRFKDAFFNPLRRTAEAVGQKYDTLFGAVKNNAVPSTTGLEDQLSWANSFAEEQGWTYSAATKKLIDKAEGLTGANEDDRILRKYYSQEDIDSLTPNQRGTLLNTLRRGEAKKAAGATVREDFNRPAAPTPEPESNATVAKLLQLRSDALEHTRTATSARDKTVGFHVVEGVDKTLEDSGLVDPKKLGAINREWRDYREVFDKTLRKGVANATDPGKDAGMIFGDRAVFSRLWKASDPSEKSYLRRTYGDWLLGKGAVKLGDPDQKEMLRQMFPGTPLADSKNWIHLDDKMAKASDIMQASPELRQEFVSSVAKRMNEVREDYAGKAVQEALSEAKGLPDGGKELKAAIAAAKTLPDKANAATQYFATLAQKAPVQALTEGRTSGGRTALQAWKTRAQWWVPLTAATAMSGHPSMWGAAGLAMGAPLLIHAALQRGLKYALSNPENAAIFWQTVSNPTSRTGLRTFARMFADGLAAEGATQVNDMLGTRLTTQDEPTSAAPASPPAATASAP